jgi:hypothetical protein
MPRSAHSILFSVIVLGLLAIPTRADAQTVVSAEAILSDSRPAVAGRNSRPVEYVVDLGTTFVSISDLSFFFVFAEHDPLDPDECLAISGDYAGENGFCDVGEASQAFRLLTFPCVSFPDVCGAYLDGSDGGLITALNERVNAADRPIGRSSVRIDSFTVTVTGVAAQ